MLINPANLPLWLGSPIIFDPKVDGLIEVEIDEGHRFAGKFLRIDAPHLLEFTWGWRTGPIDIAPGSTSVELQLTQTDQTTELTLIHFDLGDWAERNIIGWTAKLERLEKHIDR